MLKFELEVQRNLIFSEGFMELPVSQLYQFWQFSGNFLGLFSLYSRTVISAFLFPWTSAAVLWVLELSLGAKPVELSSAHPILLQFHLIHCVYNRPLPK